MSGKGDAGVDGPIGVDEGKADVPRKGTQKGEPGSRVAAGAVVTCETPRGDVKGYLKDGKWFEAVDGADREISDEVATWTERAPAPEPAPDKDPPDVVREGDPGAEVKSP